MVSKEMLGVSGYYYREPAEKIRRHMRAFQKNFKIGMFGHPSFDDFGKAMKSLFNAVSCLREIQGVTGYETLKKHLMTIWEDMPEFAVIGSYCDETCEEIGERLARAIRLSLYWLDQRLGED